MLQLTCENQTCRLLSLKYDSWPDEPEESETAETDRGGGSAPAERQTGRKEDNQVQRQTVSGLNVWNELDSSVSRGHVGMRERQLRVTEQRLPHLERQAGTEKKPQTDR